jgi:hypothetical protein
MHCGCCSILMRILATRCWAQLLPSPWLPSSLVESSSITVIDATRGNATVGPLDIRSLTLALMRQELAKRDAELPGKVVKAATPAKKRRQLA